MRSPWLKEHLLDDPEVELPAATPEKAELEQAIEKWRLERSTETSEEKTMRIFSQGRTDRLVIVGYGIVMAISGQCT